MMHFCNANPSCTGVTVVDLYPESIITAVDLPHANDDNAGDLTMYIPGT
jgi:expansin (peptidoglycan-binding protein)